MAEKLEQKPEVKAVAKAEAKVAAKTEELKKESIVEQAKKIVKEKKSESGKPAKSEKKDEKSAHVAKGLARVYTIPLKLWTPRTKKTKKSIAHIKTFILKHTKQEALIDPELNEYMWSRGKQKPPAKVRVSVQTTEEGKALVSLKKQ